LWGEFRKQKKQKAEGRKQKAEGRRQKAEKTFTAEVTEFSENRCCFFFVLLFSDFFAGRNHGFGILNLEFWMRPTGRAVLSVSSVVDLFCG
jgi:hypothetical protein